LAKSIRRIHALRVAARLYRRQPRLLRVLEIIAAGVPLAFILGSTFLKFADPGYRLVQNTISELVVGPFGVVLTVLFYLMGISTLLLAYKLLRLHPRSARLRLGAAAISICALSFILIGVFHTDLDGQARTLHGYIHEYTTGVLMFLFPVAAFLTAPALKKAFKSGAWSAFSRASGGLQVALMLVIAVFFGGGFGFLGILERLIMVNGLAWMQVISVKMLLS
jgi:hypothetical protein